ncbi:ribonuclease H-like domain-containing protein, partial [Tanacetum coccineum]
IIASLHREFDMTNLGALNYFLGISATRHSTGLFLSQRNYAIQILEHAYTANCNLSRTPFDTESKLGPEGVLVPDPTLYRSLAGVLLQTSANPLLLYCRSWYQGVANIVAETAWLRGLLRELNSPLSTITLVYCDNVSAIYLSANPVEHQRTKHIEIDIHFVRDMVTTGQA